MLYQLIGSGRAVAAGMGRGPAQGSPSGSGLGLLVSGARATRIRPDSNHAEVGLPVALKGGSRWPAGRLQQPVWRVCGGTAGAAAVQAVMPGPMSAAPQRCGLCPLEAMPGALGLRCCNLFLHSASCGGGVSCFSKRPRQTPGIQPPTPSPPLRSFPRHTRAGPCAAGGQPRGARRGRRRRPAASPSRPRLCTRRRQGPGPRSGGGDCVRPRLGHRRLERLQRLGPTCSGGSGCAGGAEDNSGRAGGRAAPRGLVKGSDYRNCCSIGPCGGGSGGGGRPGQGCGASWSLPADRAKARGRGSRHSAPRRLLWWAYSGGARAGGAGSAGSCRRRGAADGAGGDPVGAYRRRPPRDKARRACHCRCAVGRLACGCRCGRVGGPGPAGAVRRWRQRWRRRRSQRWADCWCRVGGGRSAPSCPDCGVPRWPR